MVGKAEQVAASGAAWDLAGGALLSTRCVA